MAQVFISYSRKDQAFVRRLNDALAARDREAWIDWKGIPPTAEWMAEVCAAIESTEVFLCILSPDSLASTVVDKEMAHAVENSKRLIPVVCRDVESTHVPEALARLNWIMCRDTDDFENAVDLLIQAIDTDLDWARTHTRILVRTLQWSRNRKDRSYLLNGRDLRDAEQWLAQSGGKQPAPTNDQTQYIVAGRHAATTRQRVILGAVAVGFVISVILAAVALTQRNQATTARDGERQQKTIAEQRRNEAEGSRAAEQHQREIAEQRQTEAENARQGERQQRVLAQQRQKEAEQARDEATRQQHAAEQARDLAEQRLHAALYRQLVMSSDSNRTTYPYLSAMLAREALKYGNGPEANEALFQSLAHCRARPRPALAAPHVRSAQWSPDGRRILAIYSVDKELAGGIWDLDGHQVAALKRAGSGPIHAGAWSPDGAHILTVQRDKAILWDSEGKFVSSLAIKTGFDWTTLEWSPDSQHFAVTNDMTTVATVWDLTGKQTASFPLAYSYAKQWSPDGEYIATHNLDGQVRISDRSGKPVATIPIRTNQASVAWSPNGDFLLVRSEMGPATLWTKKGESVTSFGGPTSFFSSVAWSPDGALIFATHSSDFAEILDLKGHSVPVADHGAGQISWSADGSAILGHCSDVSSALCVWGAAGKRIATLDAAQDGTLYGQWSPDSKMVLTWSLDGVARIWDLQTLVPAVLDGHRMAVTAAEWSADGQRVLTTGFDKTVRIWDAWGNPQLTIDLSSSPSQQPRARWSSDGQRIVTWDEKAGQIRDPRGNQLSTFEVRPGLDLCSLDAKRVLAQSNSGSAEVRDFLGHTVALLDVPWQQVSRAAWSPDGAFIITLGPSGAGAIWAADGSRVSAMPAGPANVSALGWSPDGNRVLIVYGGTIGEIRDIHGNREAVLDGGQITGLVWSPDGQFIFTMSGRLYEGAIWDRNGHRLARMNQYFAQAAWSPNSQLILTLTMTDGQIWNRRGERVAQMEHGQRIWHAVWSPDGSRILTASYDRTGAIWDINSNRLVTLAGHGDQVQYCAWSPDGSRVLTASFDRSVRVWPPVPLLDFANQYLTRGFTDQERARYLDLVQQPPGKTK